MATDYLTILCNAIPVREQFNDGCTRIFAIYNNKSNDARGVAENAFGKRNLQTGVSICEVGY
jgi:hypothetical protein